MALNQLPRRLTSVRVPPIKSQGIKTKLVPFILGSVRWNGKGKWVEPFVGSGVVLFNAAPERALAADTNEHLIKLYQGIQRGKITPNGVEQFLKKEGAALRDKGESHFYEIRDRFNEEQSPLDFLFLNRSCFNGMIRFNRAGKFNVPFCRKPDRFRQAYVTKICNQVGWIAEQMRGRDWVFSTREWQSTLAEVDEGDFVYLDPPYIGRHTDYYNHWTADEADQLAVAIKGLNVGFAYSMWKENRFRENDHLLDHFQGYPVLTYEHFYHIGPTETLRNSMTEALVVAPSAVPESISVANEEEEPEQLGMKLSG